LIVRLSIPCMIIAEMYVCVFSLSSFLHSSFMRSVRHPDLHSFPTRRSSDLVEPPRTRASPASLHGRWPCQNRTRVPKTRMSGMRSEEHTSELQSRFDLVCRLLLEKKKQGTSSTLDCEERSIIDESGHTITSR